MAIKLRPLSDRLVVKPDPAEDMTAGGLYVPASAKYEPQIGTVISAGPGWVSQVPVYVPSDSYMTGGATYPRREMVVLPGDRIFYPKNAGSVVQIDRDEFIIIRETDVLAFVVEKIDEDAATPDLGIAYLDPRHGSSSDS